jgi:hypothetical protein
MPGDVNDYVSGDTSICPEMCVFEFLTLWRARSGNWRVDSCALFRADDKIVRANLASKATVMVTQTDAASIWEAQFVVPLLRNRYKSKLAAYE